MRAGTLRSVVVVSQRRITKAANGEAISTFWPLGDAAADIQAQAGRELQTAGTMAEETAYLIKLRWTPSLAALRAADRIDCEGVGYDLTFVQNTGMRNVELLCGARVARPSGEALP